MTATTFYWNTLLITTTRSANLLLPGCDVSDEQQRHRMGCRRYRKANPALSVTKLTCAMGHLALLPASTTLRGCGSALQHPLPAPLPRRPLATSLLLAAIEMEPAKRSGGLRQCQADFQPTVRHADADLGAKVVTQFDQRDMKVSPPINAWIICASWSAD